MQTSQTNHATKVTSLTAARERRKYIDIANASEHWLQTKASFALEGIELNDDHAERAGRLIAGDTTLEQSLQSLMLDCKT